MHLLKSAIEAIMIVEIAAVFIFVAGSLLLAALARRKTVTA